ncbi:MAG: hypothetical protein Ct9H300mP1_27230 [Planctomycetaceae bacterium]|nr:MAG: hypothetical protein Ct9H300mP1_27230 [Planctomycetaceae bacterium]
MIQSSPSMVPHPEMGLADKMATSVILVKGLHFVPERIDSSQNLLAVPLEVLDRQVDLLLGNPVGNQNVVGSLGQLRKVPLRAR